MPTLNFAHRMATRRRAALALALLAGLACRPAAAAVPAAPGASSLGQDVFAKACADCHGVSKSRAPNVALLRFVPATVIRKSLTTGIMKKEAKDLSADEIQAVSQFLGAPAPAGLAAVAPPACQGKAAEFDYDEPPPFEFAGRDPGNQHFVPAELSGITPGNVGTLRVKYAVGIPGVTRMRSQPALAGGAIYVGTHDGMLYALDRETGCVRWTFEAATEIRNAVVVSSWRKGDRSARPLVYAGDQVGTLYAVDAVTGKLAWRDVPQKHGSATLTSPPLLARGRLYQPVSSLEEVAAGSDDYPCCTFRGSVVAYDAATGKRLWQTFMTDPPRLQGRTAKGVQKFGPSGAAIWSVPAVDLKRGQLLVTTGDNYTEPATRMSDAIVALDLDSGRVRWVYQALAGDIWNTACWFDPKGAACPEKDGPDYDFGAGPVVTSTSDGRGVVLAGQKSGWVYAVDADHGKRLWKTRIGRGGMLGGIHFGLGAIGDTLYVPVSDIEDGRQHDMPAQPGLFALDIGTGAVKWRWLNTEETCHGRPFCDAGLAATITTTPGLVFAGSLDGWVRAYDSATGKVLWRMDTTAQFDTVGGGKASGGSMQGITAPLLYRGTVVMVSGYDFTGRMPGNLLLVLDAR